VTDVHPSVKTLKRGSRVAVEPYKVDGTCAQCKAGQFNQCDQIMCLGIHASGGMVESATVLASMCYTLPDGMSLELGAVVEPLSVAWHGVVASGIKPGKSALLVGTGPIGLATICCLKALGVGKIVVSGRSKKRNEHVRGWGIATVLDSAEDVVKRTAEIFDG
jgi:(R,R)-butanediol dehydrogenase / meso-butanediol dehydrogenase / diacetyl reductase